MRDARVRRFTLTWDECDDADDLDVLPTEVEQSLTMAVRGADE